MILRSPGAFTAFCFVCVCPSAALAAERGYTLTSFDKIQVEGPYTVSVETGKSTSARATGTNAAIERISVSVISRTLVIRGYKSGWGGWPGENPGPVSVRVTTQMLQSAMLSGSGTVTVDRMTAPRLAISVFGSGNMSVGSISSDRMAVTLAGSGMIDLKGQALIGNVNASGSGTVNAAAMTVGDLSVTARSSGSTTISARRSAKINASGAGSVDILGNPACTVEQAGSGTVSCGRP